MLSTASLDSAPPAFSPVSLFQRAIALADCIPLSLVQFASRMAVGYVFWNSAQSKLASWPVTIQLFAMEYQVPLLPPNVAAALGTTTELCSAILIVVGLFTRFAALALLGLVTVIQVFVYPSHWGEHLLWASLLLLLLARGAGVVSLDHLAKRLIFRSY